MLAISMRHWGALALLLLLLPPVLVGAANVNYPRPPTEGLFYRDLARMIEVSEGREINLLLEATYRDVGVPIIIATIDSLDSHGAYGMTIEEYATNLFNEWGIGSQENNRGILLLVSAGDSKARIELGADWGRGHDGDAKRIMDGVLIPKFKVGMFSEGIRDAAKALDAFARGERIPAPPLFMVHLFKWGSIALLIGLGVFLFTTPHEFPVPVDILLKLLYFGLLLWVFTRIMAYLLIIFMPILAPFAKSGRTTWFWERGGVFSRRFGGGGGGFFGGGSSGGGGASGGW